LHGSQKKGKDVYIGIQVSRVRDLSVRTSLACGKGKHSTQK
jgi:hypothetical protein